jgi:hypothetical protein
VLTRKIIALLQNISSLNVKNRKGYLNMAIINEEYASQKELTVIEAYVLSRLTGYIAYHIEHGKNRIEGRTWNRTTAKQFAKALGFGFTRRRVQLAFSGLIKKNIILQGNFNKAAFDNTLWYALVEEDLVLQLHSHRTYKGDDKNPPTPPQNVKRQIHTNADHTGDPEKNTAAPKCAHYTNPINKTNNNIYVENEIFDDKKVDRYRKQAKLTGWLKDFWDEYPADKRRITKAKFIKLVEKLDISEEQGTIIVEDVKNRKVNHREWKQGYIQKIQNYFEHEIYNTRVTLEGYSESRTKSVNTLAEVARQARDQIGRCMQKYRNRNTSEGEEKKEHSVKTMLSQQQTCREKVSNDHTQYTRMTNDNQLTCLTKIGDSKELVYFNEVTKLIQDLSEIMVSRPTDEAGSQNLIEIWTKALSKWPLEYINRAKEKILNASSKYPYMPTLNQFLEVLESIMPEECGFMSWNNALRLCYLHKTGKKLMKSWPNPAVYDAYFKWHENKNTSRNDAELFRKCYCDSVRLYLLCARTLDVPAPSVCIEHKKPRTKSLGAVSLNNLRSCLAI